jgi:hypothetical protein
MLAGVFNIQGHIFTANIIIIKYRMPDEKTAAILNHSQALMVLGNVIDPAD